MHPKDLRIVDFTYDLPDDRIAKFPLEKRDASKLLVYKNEAIAEAIYQHIAHQIPSESLLVFNQTKVIHARLLFQKATGGIIEIFCLEPHEQYADIQTAMLQKEKVWWKCMIGGASKWKHGVVLEQQFSEQDFILRASIIEKGIGYYIVELSWDDDDLSFAEVLHIAGKVPLPPYLHREAMVEDENRYQTIYAKDDGSVAAPTAGLHFTQDVLDSFVAKNIHTAFVTLHVGAGTFKPVKAETMQEHDMHAEWMEVNIATIQELILNFDKGIIAVGTTSLRTIESLYWIGAQLLKGIVPDMNHIAVHQWLPYGFDDENITAHYALKAIEDWLIQNHQQKIITRTQILIAPGYEFKIIKGLITNFHQPQSTLLLLVAALIGDDWRKVYQYAMEHDFRFLSYGDGSLLWA